MFNSETLEVGVGMVFLFLLVSIVCTAIKEWLEGVFKWRAMDLERALRSLLADSDGTATEQLLGHPLLDSLFQGSYDPRNLRSSWLTPGKGSLHVRLSKRRNLPSYIPAGQFATALLDHVGRGVAGSAAESQALSVASVRAAAAAFPSPKLRRVVLSALDHSGGDLDRARLNIEQWFNGTMDRASGWYKRRTQAILFMIGLAIAVGLNIDALNILHRLTADKTLRDVVVREASAAPGPSAASAPLDRIGQARSTLEAIELPTGWKNAEPAHSWVPMQLCEPAAERQCRRTALWGLDWIQVLLGWLITAFAAMLGAPFWFDVLNKFMVIRSTVKPHEKSREEGSEDRPDREEGALDLLSSALAAPRPPAAVASTQPVPMQPPTIPPTAT
jgi:hypothetical protein